MENGLTSSPKATKSAVRDIRLDALRGLLLIIMTIDHLPTVLWKVTYEWVGYVSAAEGFVFLSGFVSGLTYTRVSLQQGNSEARRRASLRARMIYFFHLCTFIALLFALRPIPPDARWSEPWLPLFRQNAVISILMGATFLSQPQFLCVLPLYCVLVFAAPHIISQFKNGNASLVIGTSISLWMVDQFHVTALLLSSLPPGLPVNLGAFDFLAWQGIFIVGLYCGFKYYTHDCQRFPIPISVTMYAGIVILVLFLCRHNVFFGRSFSDAMNGLADRTTLGIVRVLNFSALCVFITSFSWSKKHNFLLKSLAYLGRNSLQVFSFQIFLVYAMNVWWGETDHQGWPAGSLMAAVCITSLYLPAWISEQVKRSGRIALIG